jgi:peptidyl-prolyl cis-trans isomerase SurA
MRFLSLSLLMVLGLVRLSAQKADPVLFSVDGRPVKASEFSYIYSKNNRDDADFSEQSLREYLDLYTKFKQKVREAYAMGLDTLPSLQAELAGYRKQLAESYLNDKEITDRLVREAYDRTLTDVHVAHILVRMPSATDTLAAYNRIEEAYKRLKKGDKWEDVVKSMSEDEGTKASGGDLGFITALLPSGFYAFETAAYTTPAGSFSKPVKTSLGYHVVKVIETRPARGEVEVAHILLRVKPDNSDEKTQKAKIDDLYKELQGGAKFEDVARKNSEDKKTADRGGFIGPIGINQFEKGFEDAAFGLANDGDYSAPVRTTLGWHIVKRTRLRPALPFESVRRRLEVQVTKDERVATARLVIIARIKEEAGYKVDQAVFDALVAQTGEDLQTYRWQVPSVTPAPMVTMGNEVFTNLDFANYVRNNARIRMSLPKGTPNKEIMDKVLTEFANEKALIYEEKNLAKKYPEFANLMREYEEGILLFEATKQMVWDRAGKDTVGLTAFYEANKTNYMWDERLEVATLTVDSAGLAQLPALKKQAAKKSLAAVQAKAAKKGTNAQVATKLYQKEETLPEGLGWTAGLVADNADGRGFMKVERIVPPTPKTLDEARGYIIADYQDKLEKDWVASLQAKYAVKVNEDVLRTLIKS